MPIKDLIAFESYPHGGPYKEFEHDEDFFHNEDRFKSMYMFTKKIEFDTVHDDEVLCNHLSQEELQKLIDEEEDSDIFA